MDVEILREAFDRGLDAVAQREAAGGPMAADR
jgi:hypothetical protein